MEHLCLFLSCVCYAFVHVCLFVPCGHQLGKVWPLGSSLWCLIVVNRHKKYITPKMIIIRGLYFEHKFGCVKEVSMRPFFYALKRMPL